LALFIFVNFSETAEITKILAIDCEYVGTGIDGKTDSLARVSIVNADGKCVYDKYVAQTEPVTDYRTEVSGIRPGHLINGEKDGASSLCWIHLSLSKSRIFFLLKSAEKTSY
jgi:hypothetical protein